ncbi:MAG: 16S rRNA (uracil(1498)-N(3))-methyltransferase, partial [Coriobacteriales bacterium]|nr:16S rRNA (uracil(1498)-N(3))-methyltransferase [Coriobacteriales bacterium]
MSIPHFFIGNRIEGKAGDAISLSLPQDVAKHLRSLRVRPPEHLIFVDSPGHAWELELTTAPSRGSSHIEALLLREHEDSWHPDLTLVQAISAANRMDQTIRQVTELGVSRIIPLESERSTARLDATGRVAKRARWERIAQGAAEQSGLLRLPSIEPACDLSTALSMLVSYDALLFFWEEPGGMSLSEALEGISGLPATPAATTASTLSTKGDKNGTSARVAAVIGPEGGFSEAEAACIRAAGGHTITMGSTIL